MSEQRVNLVRKGFEAWNSEDPQWMLEHMSPEVEWVAPERDPFPGTYKGFLGVQEFWSRWRNAVGQLKLAPEEVIDAGDHIVVIAHRWARNEITGLRIEDRDRPGLHLRRRRQVHPRAGVLRPRHCHEDRRARVAATRSRRLLPRHRHRRSPSSPARPPLSLH